MAYEAIDDLAPSYFSFPFLLNLTFQQHWISLCSSYMSSSFLPQDLCMCSSLSLTPPFNTLLHSHCVSPLKMLIIPITFAWFSFFATLWFSWEQWPLTCAPLYFPYDHCDWKKHQLNKWMNNKLKKCVRHMPNNCEFLNYKEFLSFINK